MNLVSPLHTSKPAIPMSSEEVNMNDKQPTEYLNEYNVFLLLEKTRTTKLKELYHNTFAILTMDDQANENPLPKFPIRYRCLEGLSAQWIKLEVGKQRRDLSSNLSGKEQFKSLDRVTKMFLQDVVNILKEGCHGSTSQSRRSILPYIPSLNPTTITPPSSPVTLPPTQSQESMLRTQEKCSKACNKEVDMSNDEILSLWNHAVPTVDGIDFDVNL
mmetsp:Transcript_26510/g.45243  ORF Transcript_26510/g.45243 Transcript_26510/m.45243 type:complete len:216 (-) Transcript_26510:1445-2092(-)